MGKCLSSRYNSAVLKIVLIVVAGLIATLLIWDFVQKKRSADPTRIPGGGHDLGDALNQMVTEQHAGKKTVDEEE